MESERIDYSIIGTVHSGFEVPEGTPIQPGTGHKGDATGEIKPEYRAGLADLEGFSHIILVYHFNRAKSGRLEVKPYLDSNYRGVFATRSPARPNPIGISIVELKSVDVKRGVLDLGDVDILDSTPILDIKPYVSRFDQRENTRDGWLDDKLDDLNETRDDGRFAAG